MTNPIAYSRYYYSESGKQIIAYGEYETDTFTVLSPDCRVVAVTTSLDAADAYIRLCCPEFRKTKTIVRAF